MENGFFHTPEPQHPAQHQRQGKGAVGTWIPCAGWRSFRVRDTPLHQGTGQEKGIVLPRLGRRALCSPLDPLDFVLLLFLATAFLMTVVCHWSTFFFFCF